MKKHIFIILLLFAMPALVLPVTEEGAVITKLSMEPVPFNERRDPVADSPYNAFDGDVKTAAIYSDFTMEFSKPVTIDQIKIVNGNASNKDLFKRYNRERDVEITLYTVSVKSDAKAGGQKGVKSKKNATKKAPVKKKEDKVNAPKTEEDNKEKDKTDKIKPDQEKKEKDKMKTDTPEKIVQADEYDSYREYQHDNVKLYLTASETQNELEKKAGETFKTDKAVTVEAEKKIVTPVKKKSDKKIEKKEKIIPEKKKSAEEKKPLKEKSVKNKKTITVKPGTADKKGSGKKETAKSSLNKTVAKKEKTQVKEKGSGKNIIEITDSKKSTLKKETAAAIEERKNKTAGTETMSETEKAESLKTEIKKSLAADDKSPGLEPDKPAEKVSIPEIKKTEKKKQVVEKKRTVKSDNKKTAKDKSVKNKDSVKNKTKKIESKDKVQKEKLPAADTKIIEEKKSIKPEIKKILPDKKTPAGKILENIKDKKTDKKKDEKKQAIEKKPADDVTVKKMTGVVKIENDNSGRVLVYASLKDSMEFQNIDLKGEYVVTKIDFRTRDDEYYKGIEPDRSGITEIAFLNNGKRVQVQGIESMKKSYIERYSKALSSSISGETFIMYENNDITLRMTFKKDGRIEFFDRFKCSKKGGPDCTSVSMPDMWRVTDGKLYMRYHTLWRLWKYELDSQSDMLDEKNEQIESPRWMKIYYKSDNGFTDKYLDLVRSDKGVWAE